MFETPTPSDDLLSDETLVALINQGDASAFEVLYRRHRDWVVNLALRFTGDRDLALDVLQDTFLYVLRKFPGLQLSCQFRSFLYPAVRNLSIAARRKSVRCQGDAEANLDEYEAPVETPDAGTERGRLAAGLASLPPAQREVLLLRFVDGFSLDEIAGALNVPTGTVKSRLHNALAALRKDSRVREFFLE